MTTTSARAADRRLPHEPAVHEPAAHGPAERGPVLRVAVEVHPRGSRSRALCVMTLTGDLDLWSAPELRRATDLALPAPGTTTGTTATVVAGSSPDVVLDLAAVEFVDSAGLGALLSTLRRTKALGGRLAVVGAGQQARRLLTTTGVDRVISLHATLVEALSARTATA